MLQHHAIVSGANAGRPGPLRATAGCLCPDCQSFRAQKAEDERQRYATDPAHRQQRLDRAAERWAEHGEEISARDRERYRWDDEHAERLRSRSREWGRRNAPAKAARQLARYRARGGAEEPRQSLPEGA